MFPEECKQTRRKRTNISQNTLVNRRVQNMQELKLSVWYRKDFKITLESKNKKSRLFLEKTRARKSKKKRNFFGASESVVLNYILPCGINISPIVNPAIKSRIKYSGNL